MNAAGYDFATLGNHEFDFGTENMLSNLSAAEFKVICADAFDKDNNRLFDGSAIYTTSDGVKIGFFGMATPETQNSANPALLDGVTFSTGEEFYSVAQTEINELRAAGADIVICVGHLGVDEESGAYRSTELYKNVTGLDFIIDGHSHTVMTSGENGEPVQSTGTKVANVGVVVIDSATKAIESNTLVSIDDKSADDDEVLEAANKIKAEVDEELGQVFAKTTVTLNGERNDNRTGETNLGDLICDAMVWQVLKNEGSVTVDKSNVVAINNAGGIRATVKAGDITKQNLIEVLPFGNTVSVIYVKGSALLEALEASTWLMPAALPAFPQVSGIEFSIDTTKEYDANDETYPGSTYYGPKTINRVTITSVNGKPFDENATYAVVTNDFIAAGGDTYYALSSSAVNIDTGIRLDEAVADYITEELNGVVGEQYADTQGRISVVTEAPTEKPTETPTEKPTEAPTEKPTETPTEKPTEAPTEAPTETPTEKPTEKPTEAPTEKPTETPTEKPTETPTEAPTEKPTETPTEKPTETPTTTPTEAPAVTVPDSTTAPAAAAPDSTTLTASSGSSAASDDAQTGDNNMAVIYAMLLLASGAVLTAAAAADKKKKAK
jgi:2',3'-cyclic-nucleotide 2'-phosphodiesterase (5'-nucleotidase family)